MTKWCIELFIVEVVVNAAFHCLNMSRRRPISYLTLKDSTLLAVHISQSLAPPKR